MDAALSPLVTIVSSALWGGMGAALCWSPDGRILGSLFTQPFGSHVALCDWEEGVADEHIHDELWIDAFVYAPETQGQQIVFASSRGVFFYDLSTGERRRLTHDGASFLAFSPDGQQLAVTNGLHVCLWDLATATISRRLKGHHKEARAIAYLPDGSHLATAGNRDVLLWPLAAKSKARRLKGHTEDVVSLVASPDSNWLLSLDQSGCVCAWSMPHGELSWQISGDYNAVVVQESMAFVGCGREIVAFDLRAGEERYRWTAHSHRICSLAIHPDGGVLCSSAEQENQLCLWDVTNTMATPREAYGHLQPIRWLKHDIQHDVVLSASQGRVVTYRASSGDMITCVDLYEFFSEEETDALRFPNASTFALLSEDGERLFVAFGATVACIMRPFLPDCIAWRTTLHQLVSGVLFCSEQLLLVSGPTSVNVLRCDDGQIESSSALFRESIVGACVDDEHFLLISEVLELWSLSLLQRLERMDLSLPFARERAEISPDRRFLAALDAQDRLLLFDVDDGLLLRVPVHPSPFSMLSWAPESDRLYLVTRGGECIQFDVERFVFLQNALAPSDDAEVTAITALPDRRLAIADNCGSCHIWPLPEKDMGTVQDDFSVRMSTLRELLHRLPGNTVWAAICELFDGWDIDNGLEAGIDYARNHLSNWDLTYRIPKQIWLNDVYFGRAQPRLKLAAMLRFAGPSRKLRQCLTHPDLTSLEYLYLSGDDGNGYAEAIATHAPLDWLKRIRFFATGLGDRGLALLRDAASLSSLQSFTLVREEFGVEGLDALLQSPWIQSLACLTFEHCEFDPEAWESVLTALDAPLGLSELHFTGCDPSEVDEVLQTLPFQSLRALSFENVGLADVDFVGLEEAEALADLERLSLSRNYLGGLSSLAKAQHIRGLKHLDVSHCRLAPDALEELLTVPFCGELERLYLHHNPGLSIAPLLVAPATSSLEELGLSHCGLSSDDISELLGVTSLSRLSRLELGVEKQVRTAGALIRATHLEQLRWLDLSGWVIEGQEWELFCQAEHLSRLEVLLLDDVPIDEVAARALAHARFLPYLRHIRLHQRISAACEAIFQSSPRLMEARKHILRSPLR